MALKRAEHQKELDAMVIDREVEFIPPVSEEPIIEDKDETIRGIETLTFDSDDQYTYLEVVAPSGPSTPPFDANNDKKTLLYSISMVTVSLPVGEVDNPNQELSIIRTPLLENGIFTGTLNALKHGKELYSARVEEMGLDSEQFSNLGEVDVQALEQEIAAKEKMDGYMKSIAKAYLQTMIDTVTEEDIAAYLLESGESVSLRIQETQQSLEQKMRQMTDVYLMGKIDPTDAEITKAGEKANLYVSKMMGFLSNSDLKSSEPLELSVISILSAIEDRDSFSERMHNYDDQTIARILKEVEVETQGTNPSSEGRRIPITHSESEGTEIPVIHESVRDQIERNVENVTKILLEGKETGKAEKKFAKQVEQMREVYREVYGLVPSDESHIPDTLSAYQTYWEDEIRERKKAYLQHPSVISESDKEEAEALAERAVLDEISRQVGKKIDDPAKMGLAYYKEFVRDPEGLAERIRQEHESRDREDELALSAVETDAWGLVSDAGDIEAIAIEPEYPDEDGKSF